MNIDYSWSFVAKKIVSEENSQNYSLSVQICKTGIEESGLQGNVHEVFNFEMKSTEENFVPKNNLTEEMLIDMVIPLITEEKDEYMKSEILKQLEELKKVPSNS